MATRTVIRKNVAATSKFAKAIADVIKKLSPILAPLGKLLGQLIMLGAKCLNFMVNNLGLLVMFIVWLLYDSVKGKFTRR